MEGKHIGLHIKEGKPCGIVMERERNKGKHGTKSFHWVCNNCGREPESKDIRQ